MSIPTGPDPLADPFAGMVISPGQAATARQQLTMLAEGATDPRIQQLARDVLGGRTNLRSALLGPAHEHALNTAMSGFSSWYQGLSEDERAEQEHRGRDHAEQQLRAGVKPASPVRARTRTDDDGDWGPPRVLRRR